nr:antiviral RADAR system adenosine triphosphatase RdrA [Massilia sp. JS1662]
MSATQETIHFPIDTGDQAYFDSRKNLLAHEVYERIGHHLHTALDKVERIWREQRPECIAAAFERYRSHDAVLLNGGRGTGKSSVLVNLARYFSEDRALEERLLILKPVDPTLLENGDDLFLNVIVAALLRDTRVRAALREHVDGTTEFYEELNELGSALEGIQKIGTEYGLDKLQAFVENQELAEHVHRLFHRALQLTGKRLIVLPIDDVDTSLDLAFENIEVVRKYLTTPFVVPLISGDLGLYDDVIQRKFAQRILGIGGRSPATALLRAADLAEEYERKVLPLPRRIDLPVLRTYLDHPHIFLSEEGRELIALPLLKNWLEALINDRVNGEENSERELPLTTVREFAQFVQSSRHLLHALKGFFERQEVEDDGRASPVMMKRRMIMSTEVARAVALFAEEFEAAFSIRRDETRTQRSAREKAYRDLRDHVTNANIEPDPFMNTLRRDWNRALADYAIHQRNWGGTYLIADATTHLLQARDNVLGHDLFRPQRHGARRYAHFAGGTEFGAAWQDLLAQKAPAHWLARLPRNTLLSYPGPETGRRVGPQPQAGNHFAQALAQKLLVHWSYYSPTERGDLLLCGRVFELLVASLTCDLVPADLTRILHQPPFYSLAEFARTKTLDVGAELAGELTRDERDEAPRTVVEDDDAFESGLADLVLRINHWRANVQIARPSAWFVFVVMNKFFSQVTYINRPTGAYDAAGEVLNLAMQAFNLFWSAVGSFEKGPVFGLPQVVATVNMSGTSKNFEYHPLYMQNIAPFLQLRGNDGYYDFATGSYTYALESHPLRSIWQAALALIAEKATEPARDGVATARGIKSEIDKRIDRYVNEVRRSLNMNLTTEAIEAASDNDLVRLLSAVERRCKSEPATHARFLALRQATDLPKNSGRRRIQRIMEKLGR